MYTKQRKKERKRERETKSSLVWFRGNDQTLWPPLGTQHKHISAHTPSKALAHSIPGSLRVRRRWPYWYSFSTTCFEHLRVQSSYFAIVQPLTPVHLLPLRRILSTFQRWIRVHTRERANAHVRRCFQEAWKGRAANNKNPRVLINVVEFIRTIFKYHNAPVRGEEEGGGGEGRGGILFERCPRSKILN